MSYAQVTTGTITQLGPLPKSARRLDTNEWVMGLRDAPVALQEACGWFPIVTVARPADTTTDTYDRTVELVAGDPTEVWTSRPKTQDELDADADNTDRDDIVATVLARLDSFVAFSGTASNAQLTTAVKDLARVLARMIREQYT